MSGSGTTRTRKRKVHNDNFSSPTAASFLDGQARSRDRHSSAFRRTPMMWQSRGGGYGARMNALERGYAGLCRDVQLRWMRALSPSSSSADNDTEEDEQGGSVGALTYRADANQLDRVNVVTVLACREYTGQLALFRRICTPPPGEVAIFGCIDCTDLGVGEDHDGCVIRPRLLSKLKHRRIIQVAGGFSHKVALAEDGSVYTWGLSNHGSLGQGELSDCTPLAVEGLGALSAEAIHRVSAGESHTLCAGLSGRVYFFGTYLDIKGKMLKDLVVGGEVNADTDAGEMLEAAVLGVHTRPVVVAGIVDAVDVKCGGAFNAALCRDGTLLTWGMHDFGELGRPPHNYYANQNDGGVEYNYRTLVRHYLTPLPVMFASGLKRTVESVACGACHLLVVTCPGQEDVGGVPGTKVYTSGANQYGQLGLGDETGRCFLTHVEALNDVNIRSVAAGQYHSLALDGEGNVLAFGRGKYGQLGLTDGEPEAGYFRNLPVYVKIPTEEEVGSGIADNGVEAKDPVMEISCGDSHSIAVTEGGAVYTWGFGGVGALGHGTEREYRPRRLDVAKGLGGSVVGDDLSVKVTQASCGADCSMILCSVMKMSQA